MASFDLIVSFASAARHGSFAGAARDLGLSASAVAKNVARLEERMGVRLFHRTTRQVSLSPDGEELFPQCLRILEEVEAFEAAAAGARTELRGTLRIDMPVVYGRMFILPVLARLKMLNPALKIDARFSDQMVDTIKEGLDASVRIGPLADSRLVGRMFDQQVLWTCASPAYINEHGKPESPDELKAHTCLSFRMPTSGRDRSWQFRLGKRDYSFVLEGDIRLGDGDALIQAAVLGLGLIQVPSYIAEHEVRKGSLVELLQNYTPAPMPISLVYPSHRYIPLRVRALADALAERRSKQTSSAT